MAMRSLPVCCKCGVEFRCQRNSVFCEYVDGAFWRSGDRYECPSCGVQIVTGFGDAFEREAGSVVFNDRYQMVEAPESPSRVRSLLRFVEADSSEDS